MLQKNGGINAVEGQTTLFEMVHGVAPQPGYGNPHIEDKTAQCGWTP